MKKTIFSLLALGVLLTPTVLLLPGCSSQSPEDPATPSSSPKPPKRPEA